MKKNLASLFIKIGLLLVTLIVFTANIEVYAATDLKTQYKMKVSFEEVKKQLSVSETINYTNNYNSELTDIVLHLYADSYNNYESMPLFSYKKTETAKITEEEIGDIKINSVTLGEVDSTFTEEKQVLKFDLKKPLKPGETLSIKINFTLKIPKGVIRLGYNNDVYSLSNWYPIVSIYDEATKKWDENPFHPTGESNYSDVSNYDLEVSVPKAFSLASTGVEIGEETSGEVKTIKLHAENVRDFVFITSKYYRILFGERMGVKVNCFYLDYGDGQTTVAAAQKLLDAAMDSLELFSNTFGMYPYPEVDVVETCLEGVAMEYPQLIQIGRYPTNDEMNRNNETGFDMIKSLQSLVVHEMGHQWWYVTVGNNEFKEPFLDESLTVFSTAYYYEKKYDKYDDSAVFSVINQRVYSNGEENRPIGLSVDKYKNFQDYYNAIYRRGAWVFEDLRQRVGEEKFIKIMRDYFDKFKLKNASISDFIQVIKEDSNEETSKAIADAIVSKDYYPENIKSTEQQKQIMINKQKKLTLENIIKKHPESFGAFEYRALIGEKTCLIIPVIKDINEKNKLDEMLKTTKDFLKSQYGIDALVRDSKTITEEEKSNNNLIIIGNLSNNQIYSKLNEKLPVTLNSEGVNVGDVFIKGSEIKGKFVAKNPYNKDKLLQCIFYTKEYDERLLYYNPHENQFKIVIDNKKYFEGEF